MMLPAHPMPRPTAQVAPFFDMLGAELTVQFLLQFGGAELYLSADPKGRSAVEALIGPDCLKALATSDHRALQKRVPLAKRWVAAMLHWQGHSTAHIARTLRATDVTVRGWVKGGQVMMEPSHPNAAQIDPATIRTAIHQARDSARQIGDLQAANARTIRTLEMALNQSIKGVLNTPSRLCLRSPNTAACTGPASRPA